jgi:hypothetical protein
MQVLELVHRLELDDIESIRQHPVRFPLQQMLTLVRSYMRYSSKYIGTVCGGALDTVSVVDSALSGFVVDIEVLEVVVEVDGAGTEVSAKEGGVRREYGRYVDMTFATKGDSEASLPFVEVGDDGCVELARHILHCGALVWHIESREACSPRPRTMPRGTQKRLSRSFHDHVAGWVCQLNSTNRPSIHPTSNTGCLYQITAPAAHPR